MQASYKEADYPSLADYRFAHMSHYVKTWRHPQNWMYIMSSCRCRQSRHSHGEYEKIWWSLDMWFLRYASGQTYRHMDTMLTATFHTHIADKITWSTFQVIHLLIITITSCQSNLTEDRITAADGQFNQIHQVAPMCPPMRAHWRHLANTVELVLFSAHRSPQPKRQINQFSSFCTAHRRYFTMGAPFLQNWPFPCGDLDRHLLHDSLAHPSP